MNPGLVITFYLKRKGRAVVVQSVTVAILTSVQSKKPEGNEAREDCTCRKTAKDNESRLFTGQERGRSVRTPLLHPSHPLLGH